MTKRQQIIDALDALLKTVASLVGRVEPWKLNSFDKARLPAALFKDDIGKTERLAGGSLMHTLAIAIDIADKGKTVEVDMRAIAQDILSAFDADDTLGGLLDSCNFTEFSMGASQMAEDIFVGHLVLSLKYKTSRWQI